MVGRAPPGIREQAKSILRNLNKTMNLQYASDLHLEFGSKVPFVISPEADALAFVGDIHTKPMSLRKFFHRLRRQGCKIPIFYVFGNHEIYGHEFKAIKDEYVNCLMDVVTILDNATGYVGDVRILGTTLYSDLNNPLDAICAAEVVTDFRVVRYEDHMITPVDWSREHAHSLGFLERELAKEYHPTVVLTHFVPSMQLVQPEFKHSRSNAAFHTELYWLMEKYKPEVWIYGHNHEPHRDMCICDTHVLCNQWGYPHENFPREVHLVKI